MININWIDKINRLESLLEDTNNIKITEIVNRLDGISKLKRFSTKLYGITEESNGNIIQLVDRIVQYIESDDYINSITKYIKGSIEYNIINDQYNSGAITEEEYNDSMYGLTCSVTDNITNRLYSSMNLCDNTFNDHYDITECTALSYDNYDIENMSKLYESIETNNDTIVSVSDIDLEPHVEKLFDNGYITESSFDIISSLNNSVYCKNIEDIYNRSHLSKNNTSLTSIYQSSIKDDYYTESTDKIVGTRYLVHFNIDKLKEYTNKEVSDAYARKNGSIITLSNMTSKKETDVTNNRCIITFKNKNNEDQFSITFDDIKIPNAKYIYYTPLTENAKTHEMFYISQLGNRYSFTISKLYKWESDIVKNNSIMNSDTRNEAKMKATINGKKHSMVTEEYDIIIDDNIIDSTMLDNYEEDIDGIDISIDEYFNEDIIDTPITQYIDKWEPSTIITNEATKILGIVDEIYEESNKDIDYDELLEMYTTTYYENDLSLDLSDIIIHMDHIMEERNSTNKIDKDMAGIIIILNNKGYKTKYSSSGHIGERFKKDEKRDGVLNNKLYSTARIIFGESYKFDKVPKGWTLNILDKGTGLYVEPRTYNRKKGDPDKQFIDWKMEYMSTLKTWVQSLPDRTK